MKNETPLEIAIQSTDEQFIHELEADLTGVNPQRWKSTRDPITILAVAASVATLIKTLLEIKEKISKKPETPKIVIYNINRTPLDLANATEEDLRKLLSEASK